MRGFHQEDRVEQALAQWFALALLAGADQLLRKQRRVRSDTIILREFPWFGRRIDLVTLTCSGNATAYELKLNNNRRAIQQASYNKLVFDRSYVVTLSKPTMENLKHARDIGVGFIVFCDDYMRVIQRSRSTPVHGALRRRLLRSLKG